MLLILVCISASAFACACGVFLCGGLVMYPNRYLGNIVKTVDLLKYSLAESLYFLVKAPICVYGVNLAFFTVVLSFSGSLSGSFCFLSTCGGCATACNCFFLFKWTVRVLMIFFSDFINLSVHGIEFIERVSDFVFIQRQ